MSERYNRLRPTTLVEALVNLSSYYQIGHVVDQDLYKAFELKKKASDLGDKYCQFHLAEFYEKGKGTKKDLKKSLSILSKSS